MKKLITLCVTALLVVGVSAVSFADVIATSKDVVAHLPVDSTFGMEIWDTQFDQWIPNVISGGGGTGSLNIFATSNHTIPWYINASSAGLVGEYEAVPDTLPVALSTFDGGVGLTGTVVTDLVLTGAEQSVYSAGAGEYPCAGLEIGGVFAVTSLSTTKQDLYTGTITLTMTE